MSTFQSNRQTRRRVSDRPHITNKPQFVLGEIGNLDLRSILRDEISTSKTPNSVGPIRRVVSDPVRRSDHDARTQSSEKPLWRINQTAPSHRIRNTLDSSVKPHSETSELDDESNTSDVTQVPDKDAICGDQNLPPFKKDKNLIENMFRSPLSQLPVGTTTYGQVTILPSHSLLVDFRESQRRKGLKGDQVFVVDPDGAKISVYSAPHLSSPCCLIEPLQQFSLQDLPQAYWKQYNDAARLVDQIKQRTPRIVLYSPSAKCTLMTNAPHAEIELLFSISTSFSSKVQTASETLLRLRFSRKNKSLEIARHVLSCARGEEWTKKVLVPIEKPPYVSTQDWKALDQPEKDATNQLTCFVRICDLVEELVDDLAYSSPAQVENLSLTEDKVKATTIHAELKKPSDVCLRKGPRPTLTLTGSFTSFNLAPRPLKLAATVPGATPELTNTTSTDAFREEPIFETTGDIMFSKLDSAWHSDELDETVRDLGDIQTRFLPSVGWMMFLDGASLNIDVDEDWVEFKSKPGETATMKIGDRLKAFQEFVSMFDDSRVEKSSV
ncbi:hypothetical protein H0H81_001459 [Sphagnurus paluster]|uniref:Cryptic POLO box 1 (CPB1) domain-containing protein n=1 Tax=Sphagnurus paluster TaxID=117069 RepID=A0A9P7FXH9_9AGAR|nr:hypothetical protein H0H81_001459 [Sphagnurus paluster]